MFSGIIEDIGTVRAITRFDDAVQLQIATKVLDAETKLGDSISVNGVCLTVTEISDGCFSADVMQESLDRSALGALEEGSRVNIERALSVQARLHGHVVQGHVDATAMLVERRVQEHWEVLRFSYPAHLQSLLVEKGSIAVNGTSLTISALGNSAEGEPASCWFEVSLIPTTLQETMLGDLQPGEQVNIEADILGKYVQRFFEVQAQQPAAAR